MVVALGVLTDEASALEDGDFEYESINGTEVKITKYIGSGGDVTILDTIEGKNVVEIGDSAFAWKYSMTSLTIPDSITTIHNHAFYYCKSLKTVTMPNSITSISEYTFYGCSALTSIVIPDNVTSIGNHAFYLCSSLEAVTIPDNVTIIGEQAFTQCSKLTSIDVGGSNANFASEDGFLYNNDKSILILCPGGKSDIIAIPNSVTSIGDYAFSYCSALTSVIIPNSVITIGKNAFSYCSALTSVIIPNSVITIGKNAFYNCPLTSVIMPDSVTTIGDGAFSGCSALTSVIIPDSVTAIGKNAFSRCSSLETVNIPDGVTTISEYIFYNCYALASITISDNVTTIEGGAFRGCSSLETVTISDNVIIIGIVAFAECSKLMSINVSELNTNYSSVDGVLYNNDKTILLQCPAGKSGITIIDSVTTIGKWSFAGCSSLISLTIPDSVEAFEELAFRECKSLIMTFSGDAPAVGDNCFYRCFNLIVYYHSDAAGFTTPKWEGVQSRIITPVADFDANVTSGVAPLTVQFTDTSTEIPISWAWDFGDGDTSDQQNLEYIFTKSGTYTVTLIAANAGGPSLTKTMDVIVSVPTPIADFTADITTGLTSLTVQFTDTSTGEPATYAWDFGDGNTSDQQSPEHTYAMSGNYTVTLTVTNVTGNNVTSMDVIVSIPTPIADFTTDITTGLTSLTVQFTDTSTGEPATYAWDFGDGETSTDQNPQHTFETSGTYTVKLTVTNITGNNVTSMDVIVSVPTPIADFTADITTGLTSLTVQFTDTSTGEPATYAWDFGDGNTSDQQSPEHTYAMSGNYTVTLTVTNVTGISEKVLNIEVTGPPAGDGGSNSLVIVSVVAALMAIVGIGAVIFIRRR